MPKYVLDFDLDIWIQNVEIDAENEEEAKNKLFKMSAEDIVNNGYAKDFNINELDIEEK